MPRHGACATAQQLVVLDIHVMLLHATTLLHTRNEMIPKHLLSFLWQLVRSEGPFSDIEALLYSPMVVKKNFFGFVFALILWYTFYRKFVNL